MIKSHFGWLFTLRNCFTALALWFSPSLDAQKTAVISTEELSQTIGEWTGQLIYKDYRSGKLVPIPATLKVSLETPLLFIWNYDYPKEPGKGNKDSLEIGQKGNMINKMMVKEKVMGPSGSLRIVLEERGTEGNDQKPATFQKIIESTPDSLVITKMVRLDGQPEFFQRNQYQFIRKQ